MSLPALSSVNSEGSNLLSAVMLANCDTHNMYYSLTTNSIIAFPGVKALRACWSEAAAFPFPNRRKCSTPEPTGESSLRLVLDPFD